MRVRVKVRVRVRFGVRVIGRAGVRLALLRRRSRSGLAQRVR